MVTKKTLFKLLITILALITLTHTIFQIAVFGTGISNIYEKGISGFSIGKIELGEDFREENIALSPASKAILIFEWILLAVIITIAVIKGRIDAKKELKTIRLREKYKAGSNKTDIDTLYEILKEKKHLTLNTICQLFGVEKDIAKSWCETLETGNLAILRYPRIGDPELVLVE